MSSPPSGASSLKSLLSGLHRFHPRALDALHGYGRPQFAADVGAGLTVGIVALPLAMAFAIASGVKPEQGLYTAIIAGFLISLLGGSQVQIGGPAGAFIVIVYGIVERYGLANLLIATMLAGFMLLIMGWLKLGALVRYIPVSIVIGFTNGIAVLIAVSQLRDLFGLQIAKLPADFFTMLFTLFEHRHTFNPYALGLGVLCFVGLFVWTKLFQFKHLQPLLEGRVRSVQRIPGPIVALVTLTLASQMLNLPVETIGTRFGGIPQSLPTLFPPEFTWATAKQLLFPAVTIALLGAIESLLCARVADNMTDFKRHDPNQELMAQGVANIVAPMFGGIPATGTIARTVTNVRAGAVSPMAGIVHAGALLLVILVAAPLALHVPLAVLAGILLMVAWNMGEWHEFARLKQFNPTYRTILLGTFVLTVVFDLTIAVQVGLMLACAFFIWRMSQLFRVDRQAAGELEGSPPPAGVEVRSLYGALFFGAVGKLESLADELPPDTRALILEADHLIAMDTSGLDTLEQLHRQLEKRHVALHLAGLNAQPLSLLQRSGFAGRVGTDHLHRSVADALKVVASTPQPPTDAPAS